MKKFTLAFIAFFIISTRLNAQNTTRYLTSEPSENKTMKPEETEYYSPVPSEVKGVPNFASPPLDAVLLFDGKNLDSRVSSTDGGPAKWTVANGILTVKRHAEAIHTKQSFRNCQLHIEWRTPTPPTGEGQRRGNSGIFCKANTNYKCSILIMQKPIQTDRPVVGK